MTPADTKAPLPELMPDAELKPCPICKRQPEHRFLPEENFGEWDTHQYLCHQINDHIVMAIGTTMDEAAAKWNTRASTPPAPVADDAVEAMRIAVTTMPTNSDKSPHVDVINRLAAQGYTFRRSTMTDAELEREAHELSYLTRDFKCVVGIDDAINLAKKYRG